MYGVEHDGDGKDKPAERDVPTRLAEDQFYRLLASCKRRCALYYLLEERHSSVTELATALSASEAAPVETKQLPAARSTLRLELVHNHLPRLADGGLVEYDPEAGSVELHSLHPRVEKLIRRSIEAERQHEP